MKFFLLLLLVFSSCKVLDNTHFTNLSNYEKKSFVPFDILRVSEPINYTKNLEIQQLTYEDVYRLSKSTNKLVWIHFFAPWCSKLSAENLVQLQKVAIQHDSALILLLVSTSYDYGSLRDLLEKSKITKPVFVLDGNVYGDRIRNSQQKFYCHFGKKWGNKYFDDYVIRNGVLIYFKPIETPTEKFLLELSKILKK